MTWYPIADEELYKIFPPENPKITYERIKKIQQIENEINLNFKLWLESNIQKIPQEVLNCLSELLYDNIDKIKDKRPVVLGYVKVNGRNIKIIIDDIKYGEFDAYNDTIYASYVERNRVPDLDYMRRLINHEIAHVVDKKQNSPKWMGTSQKYRNIFKTNVQYMTSAQKNIYFAEPVEFDAICSEMEADVRRFVEKNSNNRKRTAEMLLAWLKDDNNPLIFIGKDILNIWKNHHVLYRKLKLRIYKLYKNLK